MIEKLRIWLGYHEVVRRISYYICRAQTTDSPDTTRISAAGWRIVLLASLGGTLEFYDFVIFGIFAKDIADAIFPNPTPLISLMVSFAAFAAGYLARPIGGIVLSHFGDRYGRRRVFLISIFVMSGATLGMGLVPSFATWGAAASVLMVVLRLVQGFCLGGELPGALTYVVETAPRQAPFVCGVVFSCVTLGVAVATGVSLAVRTWLPAGAGGDAGVAHRVRARRARRPAEFRAAAFARGVAGVRADESSWRRGSRSARCCRPTSAASRSASRCWPRPPAFNGLYFAHMAAYMSGVLRYDPRQAVVSQTIGVIVHALGILAVGRLADRVHPRLLLRAGALALVVLAFPFYAALASRSHEPDAAAGAGGRRAPAWSTARSRCC